MTKEEAEKTVDDIIKKADTGHSGVLNYTCNITISLKKQKKNI